MNRSDTPEARSDNGDVHALRLYSTDEVCAILGIARTRYFELIASGQLRGKKLGQYNRHSKADLEAFIAGLDAIPVSRNTIRSQRAVHAVENLTIRTWAEQVGIPCPDSGRIPASVAEAYRQAVTLRDSIARLQPATPESAA